MLKLRNAHGTNTDKFQHEATAPALRAIQHIMNRVESLQVPLEDKCITEQRIQFGTPLFRKYVNKSEHPEESWRTQKTSGKKDYYYSKLLFFLNRKMVILRI